MSMPSSIIRAGAVSAFLGALILVGMMVVGGGAGGSLGILGMPGSPEQYAEAIRPVAKVLLQVMALDNVFLIAYTGAFIGAAALAWDKARLFSATGLGFALLLALLDVTENSVTVDMTRAVQSSIPIPLWEISILGLLEQIKYASGTLAVVLFAMGLFLALPKSGYAKVVGVLFLIFPVTNVVKIVGGNALLPVMWMLVMLVASTVLFWRESC